MARPDQFQLIPPNSDEEFEKLCRDLWSCKYGEEAQRVGRQGQEQHGVDIYLPGKGIGVQCKKRERDRPLTAKDFISDIEKALGFSPALKEFVIATTSKRDAKLQKLVWEKSGDHSIKGLFRISMMFWDDILERLSEPGAEKIVQKFFSVGGGIETFPVPEKMDEILSEIRSIKSVIIPEGSASVRPSEFQRILDGAKAFLQARKPKAALDLLKENEKEIRERGSNEDRYLLLARMGSAQWDLDHDSKASGLFIEALQFKPEDEKALVNAARACLIAGQDEEARRYADSVLWKNPRNESAWALRANLEPLDKSLEQIIDSIPAECRESVEVALAISVAAKRRKERPGRLREAKYWLEIAYKNNSKGSPEIPAYLGMTILELLLEEDRTLQHADRPAPTSAAMIAKAKNYLQIAWDGVRDTELVRQKADILGGLALAEMLAGDYSRAEEYISSGLGILPEDKTLLMRKAQLTFRQNRPMETADILARPVFEKIENEMDKQNLFLRAAALNEAKRYSEARELMVNFIKARPMDEDWDNAAGLLIEIVEAAEGPEASLKQAQDLSLGHPNSPFLMGFEAVLLGKTNRKEDALKALNKAKSFLGENPGKWGFPVLADACYRLEQYSDAAGYYEKAGIPLSQPSPPLRRMVLSYMKGGITQRALSICRNLRELFGPLPFYSEVEIQLLSRVDDREAAVKVADEYIKKYPDEPAVPSLKIFRMRLAWDTGKFSEVDSFLDSIGDITAWSLENQLNIGRMFAMRGRTTEALVRFYEIRRRFFHRKEAHEAYISFFLAYQKENAHLLEIKEAGKDTAVKISVDGGERRTFVIEDRPDIDPRQGELSVDYSLAKALWSKKKGEKVIWGANDYSKESITIEEVMSKFIFRLHESMESYESNFPGENFITKVKIRIPDKDAFQELSGEKIKDEAAPKGENPENQTGVMDPKQFIEMMAKNRTESMERLAQGYRSGIPLCTVARMAGQSALEVWAGFGRDSKTGIRCAEGTPEEHGHAIGALKAKPRLVVDMVTIRCLLNLEMADSVVKHYGRLVVARSTVDALRKTVLERSPVRESGFLSFGWREGRLSGMEVTAKDVGDSINVYKRDLSWIEKNADIPPSYSRLHFPADWIIQMEEVLGEAFLDTILLCLEKDRLLLADDLAFRALAKNDLKINGVWTQPVLFALLKAGVIDKDNYNRAIIKLASANYRYLHIDSSMLIQSVEESKDAKWRPTGNFHQVAAFLGGELTSNEDWAVLVAGEFLYSLWIKPETVFQRIFLAQAVLSRLIQGRNFCQTLKKLSAVVRDRCRLIPLAKREILGIIQSFLKTLPQRNQGRP